MITRTCYVVPMGKPRMTQRDRWAKRKCVIKYRIWADAIRMCMNGISLEDVSCVSWKAYFPFPDSYTSKKRESLCGAPHRVKPDRDNIDKAILDALFDQDAGVAMGNLVKVWDDGLGPRIEISLCYGNEMI
jgi:Holliday junction resolvase RusA-like endonuclease